MNLKHFKKILFTREQIEAKCKELANWVNEEYKNSKKLVIVGLMKGSIPFMSQLIKDINVDHQLDFMTISSYHGKTKSNGAPKIVMDLANSIEGKDILIAEDIIDTGKTLLVIKDLLLSRNPNSLKIITLLDKKEGRVVPFEVDKFGFEVNNVFLAGFGLDVNDKLRYLPFIGEFDKKYLKEY